MSTSTLYSLNSILSTGTKNPLSRSSSDISYKSSFNMSFASFNKSGLLLEKTALKEILKIPLLVSISLMLCKSKFNNLKLLYL